MNVDYVLNKIPQIWENMMKCYEMRGKELLDANVITPSDLYEWLRAKNSDSDDTAVVGIGLPCYSLLHNILYSIESGSAGLVMLDGIEVTNLNVPQDRLLDWFFQPVMVLKEQIEVIALGKDEVRYMENFIIFGGNAQRMKSWNSGRLSSEDAPRAAHIQGITRRYELYLHPPCKYFKKHYGLPFFILPRTKQNSLFLLFSENESVGRMIGMVRCVSNFPTYRRRFGNVVKALFAYSLEKNSPIRSDSMRSVASI